MSQQLPSYFLFEKHYQRIDVDHKEASTIAGLKKVVANACAVRLSYAFNHIAGHKIPHSPGNIEVDPTVVPGVFGNRVSFIRSEQRLLFHAHPELQLKPARAVMGVNKSLFARFPYRASKLHSFRRLG